MDNQLTNQVINPSSPLPSPPPPSPTHSLLKNYLPFIITGLIIIMVLAGGGIYLGISRINKPKSKACTKEAKICPDGSSVGRTGPNCEFAPCPVSEISLSPTPNLSLTLSPVQSGSQDDGFSIYNDKRITFLYPSGWKVETKNGLFIRTPDDNDFYGIEFSYIDFTDLYDSIKTEKAINPAVKIENLTIDGKKAVRYQSKIDETNTKGLYDTVDIEQVIGMYIISATSLDEIHQQRYKPVFEKVLTSVKFGKFWPNGCGGVDTSGELICECDGQLLKHLPPIGGLGRDGPNIGSHTCQGKCGSCCYSGKVNQSQYPSCS